MLTDTEKKVFQTIERRLQLPAWKFIFVYGILLWAIPVAALISLTNRFIFNESMTEQTNKGFVIGLIIVPFAGLLYGWILRNSYKKQYQKLKQKA